MSTKTALRLALELQQTMIELQGGLQNLIRLLAEEEPGGVPDQPKDPSGGEAHEGLTLVELDRGDFRYTKPAKVIFPDASIGLVRAWKEVVTKTIGWMIDKEIIREETPLTGKRKHPIVSKDRSNLSQTHGNPDTYIVKHGAWWIDTWGNVNRKARNLIAICESAETEPSAFRVVLRSGSSQ